MQMHKKVQQIIFDLRSYMSEAIKELYSINQPLMNGKKVRLIFYVLRTRKDFQRDTIRFRLYYSRYKLV